MNNTVTYTNVQPWLEALKEVGRMALLAVIPILIDSVTKGSVDWNLLLVTAVVAALRGVDKYLHLQGKVEENPTLVKGLTQF